ncbi:hypothetical protein [Riemerella columbipharyngis]|uniref:Uncharacterized protein n=1 Tax=Riemerella columbipharyngis TaxID=1071918 RepID=A0A1G7E8F1_9FLAO|nr:hypothetical protein [Riemerella columbipharyngis]SDE59937.1 hypothetical protein SAMN05421544_11464 [Riemerella columbipharyngis]
MNKCRFLLAVKVTAANIHDNKAVDLLMNVLYYLSWIPMKVIFTNRGYRGKIKLDKSYFAIKQE